ncbi:type III pantothenate kinase [Desulfurobacterium atlanticum]|uniref:Type III pantothenate kinase n=1 Tax=Desulfurobacterium atlanticum TaxID=240169 RepID=A0A238XME6_9BACT|nr:type III pantothenate kinase [Desulfurobacterium atlanticum]SNR59633.1 pantothenate kinase [Desulfurobacterium atlanticum]
MLNIERETPFLIDAGNTFVKVAVKEEGGFKFALKIETETVKKGNFPFKGKVAVVSSVVPSIEEVIKSNFEKVFFVSAHLPLPLKLDYKTPETLGADRIAAACGFLDYGSNGIVVLAGTAVVIDVVKDGIFQGGAILPGTSLMAKVLGRFTEQLPEVEGFLNEYPGKSTAESIMSGIGLALAGAVDRALKIADLNDSPVVLAGGYAEDLRKMLGYGIVDEFLIFRGLWNIYRWNKKGGA